MILDFLSKVNEVMILYTVYVCTCVFIHTRDIYIDMRMFSGKLRAKLVVGLDLRRLFQHK